MAAPKTAKTSALTVSIDAAPNAAEGATFLQQAHALTIIDKASHATCRQFIKDAKAFRRTVAEHYAAIKKPLNEARNTVLDMEKAHLAPIDEAITLAERSDVAFVREQQRIEQAEADRLRREAEAAEQARRDEEAAQAEAEALALEDSTNVLSERERKFIDLLVSKPDRSLARAIRCADVAGYKNPEQTVARFMILGSKIHAAIANADKAAAIRRQSEAVQSAPIIVDVAPVVSEIATVAGTAMTAHYRCDLFDVPKLLRHMADNYGTDATVTAAVDEFLTRSTPSQESAFQRMMNAQARKWKELFGQIWPMARLAKDYGVRG